MKLKVILSFMIFIFLFSFSYILADVPQMINYQGKITTPQGALIDTTIPMTFAIYTDSVGTDSLWSEAQSGVVVEKGIFSILLGSVNQIPNSVFTGDVRYLGVKPGDDSEMTPRKPIVSTGYAFNSDMLDGRHAGNNEGDVSVNNGIRNTNLNADLLDGYSSEAFISPMIPINKVVRGFFHIPMGSTYWFRDTLSQEIDPDKSVVVLKDPSNKLLVGILTSSYIEVYHYRLAPIDNQCVEYQIIEYK